MNIMTHFSKRESVEFKRSDEPVVWLLFASGGMVSAFILPAILIAVLVLSVVGFDAENVAFSYERILTMSSTLLGKLVWLTVISLPSWHAMHRIFHLTKDFKVKGSNKLAVLCYGCAAVVTGATFTLLLTLG